MMSIEAAVPADAPVMKAWAAHKLTPEYENTKRWATQEQHTEGSVARLLDGFYAGAVKGVEAALSPNTAELPTLPTGGEGKAVKMLLDADWFDQVEDFLDDYSDAEIVDGTTHANKAMRLLYQLREARS